jgi:hypothetical protein
MITLPVLQIRSKCIISYQQLQELPSLSAEQLLKRMENIKQAKSGAYSGTLTDGTKKRLTRAIDLLCQTIKSRYIYNPVTGKDVKHKLSFITLTVSSKENYTGRKVYDDCFSKFIRWLRDSQLVRTYVWKLEVQKRGQIHYHITTPSFIHYQAIRDKWNNLQRAAGYLEEYYKEKGHYDPNSTDIHSVKHVKNLANYLIKEFAKTIQNPQTTGKIWDCSQNLKKFGYHTVVENNSMYERIVELCKAGKLPIINLEQCSVLRLEKCDITQILDLQHIHNYDEFVKTVRNFGNQSK